MSAKKLSATKKNITKPLARAMAGDISKEIPAMVIGALRAAGLKLTTPRLAILNQLLLANQRDDHNLTPEAIHQKIAKQQSPIGLATIYRTLKTFETEKLVLRHDFHNQKPLYEINLKSHHDHLIDIKSGTVIEFYDKELEKLQEKIINRLGYEIIDHRLEIYAKPLAKSSPKSSLKTLPKTLPKSLVAQK